MSLYRTHQKKRLAYIRGTLCRVCPFVISQRNKIIIDGYQACALPKSMSMSLLKDRGGTVPLRLRQEARLRPWALGTYDW